MDQFRAPGSKVPLEDMVTSTVLGPLLFLDQDEAERAIRCMLEALKISSPDWSGPVHLALWPGGRTDADLRARSVEPDAEVIDAHGTCLLIEVKWGSPFGVDQLAAQWLSLRPEQRAKSQHLVVVLEPERYRGVVYTERQRIAERCSIAWPVTLISWRRLADAFRAVGGNIDLNPGTRRWALGAHAFLRREDPLSLAGWEECGIVQVKYSPWRFGREYFSRKPEVSRLMWRYERSWFRASDNLTAMSEWRFGA